MEELLARGMNIYYRGYVIDEDIRRIHYTIYGTRPHREELVTAGSSREAMHWIDQRVTEIGPENLMVWPSLFATDYQPAWVGSW